MTEARAFPWDAVSAFAFGILRLSPAEFWEMTPRELAMAMRPFLKGQGAPSRSEFEILMHNFPDKDM